MTVGQLRQHVGNHEWVQWNAYYVRKHQMEELAYKRAQRRQGRG